MENKKIDVLFGVVVIAFLCVTLLLIKDFKSQRASDIKDYTAFLQNLERQKNDKIKILAGRLAMATKENEDLKNTLAQTRNDLDGLSKKLAQQAAPAPVSEPAAATASK